MNQHVGLKKYAALADSNTLTIQRTLPVPVEAVWSWLTQSRMRRQWLADGDMDLTEGAALELIWRNDELSNPPAQIGSGSSTEQRMQSTIIEVEPNQVLSFTWANTGGVTFTLEPNGAGTELKVVHSALPDRDNLLNIAAGWHVHLDILAARIGGEEPEPFWDSWRRLKSDYEQRLPA